MISLVTKSQTLSVPLGLLPLSIMEGNAKFRLAAGENKDVVFPPRFLGALNSAPKYLG